MTKQEYEAFIDKSMDYLEKQNDWCKEEYKIGTYKTFHWDQTTGELVWSDEGVPKVMANVQFVGSYSTKSETWLWSWDNSTILAPVKRDILKVKKFGEENKLKELTTAKWEAGEQAGWGMTAISANILKAKGGYRAPDSKGGGYTFMVFTDINWTKQK